MKVIFVGGHGRCNPGYPLSLRDGAITVVWYGDQGNPTTKRFTNAILRGDYATALSTSPARSEICEHYTCASVALESEVRAVNFQKGRWNGDAYLFQAKPNFHVPLTTLAAVARAKWPGEAIEFRWVVCRSSLLSGKRGTHDFDLKLKMPVFVQDPSDKHTEVPSGEVMGNGEGALYIEQWKGMGRAELNYGSADEVQKARLRSGELSAMKQDLAF
ncbi:hypothetical protein [Falsiroseomonas sp.]|uniref:hypothetical protein n=1 Tax=Falsiroseomonas sp. TaxID=2870721 RepID=UPI0035690157